MTVGVDEIIVIWVLWPEIIMDVQIIAHGANIGDVLSERHWRHKASDSERREKVGSRPGGWRSLFLVLWYGGLVCSRKKYKFDESTNNFAYKVSFRAC